MRFTMVLAVVAAAILILTSIGGVPVQNAKAVSGDMPGWEVNDYWDYILMNSKRITPNGTVTLSNGKFRETVDSKSGNELVMRISGSGKFDFPPVSGDYSQTEVHTYNIIDLSLSRVQTTFHFTIKSGSGTIDDWNTDVSYSPPVILFKWPLSTGLSWPSLTTATTGNVSKDQYWNSTIDPSTDNRPDTNSKMHESFKITTRVNSTGGYRLTYYGPDAGAIVYYAIFDKTNDLIEEHKLGNYKFSGTEFPWLWVGIAISLVVVFLVISIVYFMLKKRKARKEEAAHLSPMGTPAPGEFGQPPQGEPFGAEGGMGPPGPQPQYGPPPGPPGPQPQYTQSGFLTAPPPGTQPPAGGPPPAPYPPSPQPQQGYPQPVPYPQAPPPQPQPGYPQPQSAPQAPPPYGYQLPPPQPGPPGPQAPQQPAQTPPPQPYPQAPPPYGYQPQPAQPGGPPTPQPTVQQPPPVQAPPQSTQPSPPQPVGIVPCSRCGGPMPSHQPFCPRCGAPRS